MDNVIISKDDDISSKEDDITSKDDDITVIHKRICMNIQNDVWKTKFKFPEKWQCCCAAVSDVRCEAVC